MLQLLCPCLQGGGVQAQNSELPLELDPADRLSRDKKSRISSMSFLSRASISSMFSQRMTKTQRNSSLDAKTLDEKYVILESKMKYYEGIEDAAVDSMGPMLLDFLGDLRQNPERYLMSENESVAALATARMLVREVERDIIKTVAKSKIEDDSVTQSMNLTLDEQSRKSSVGFGVSAGTASYLDPEPTHHSVEMNSYTVYDSSKNNGSSSSSSKEPITRHEHGRTTSVSDRWANRLADIVPTQGNMREVVNQDGTRVLKIKPKWPEWLVDEQFEVCKNTKYGPRYRHLKLTEFHILGIRSGKEITKSYTYLEVNKVYTKASMYGPVVVLEFKDGRIYHYASKFAAHIAQQIVTRMQVRASLESTTFSVPMSTIVKNHGRASLMDTSRHTLTPNVENINFSVDAIRSIIDSISEENSKSDSSSIISFAKTLKDNVLKNCAKDTAPTHNESQSIAQTAGGSKLTGTVGAAVNAVGNLLHLGNIMETKPRQIDIKEWGSRITAIQGNSPEAVVQALVNKILFDPETPEGSTRKHFVQTFTSTAFPNGAAVATRQWIEGMHGYLMTNRGVKLTNALIKAEKTNLPAGLENIYGETTSGESTDSPLHADGVSLHDLNENALTSTAYITFGCIEESVYLPLQSDLLELLPSSLPEEMRLETKLVERFRRLSTRSQTDIGIDPAYVSSLDWSSAQFELAGIERNPTPSTRLQAVVRTAKAIYTEFNKEVAPRIQRQKKKEAEAKRKAENRRSFRPSLRSETAQDKEEKFEQVMLGADDLMPIFIFVVCRTGLQTPLRNKDLLWNLCHPDQLYGEPGYYLTQYESAVAYIEDLEDDLVIR